MDAPSPASDRDVAREALASALQAAFAVARLGPASNGLLHLTALPAAVLWIHSWRPLPGLAVWCAAFGWAACAGLAVLFGAAAWRWRVRLDRAMPTAASVARVTLAPAAPLPTLSSWLALSAALASSVLWLHALAPRLVSADLRALVSGTWVIIAALGLGAKYLDAHV